MQHVLTLTRKRLACLLAALWISLPFESHAAELSDQQLADKAKRLQQIVEDKMLQEHGLIPMFVRASDYQLPTAEDYRGAYRHRHLQGKSEAVLDMPPMHVWRAWENTPTDVAYYLHAMAYQYRVTGDANTLAICRRTLGALKYIHQLGVEHNEPGFLCKPYGGKYSNQTSLDQFQCVAWGLAAYRPIAPPEDLADIDRMSKDFADFAMRHHYVAPKGYFGRNAHELRERSDYAELNWQRAVIVLPMLNLAWYATGDDKFPAEINRWYQAAKDEKLPALDKQVYACKGFGDRARNIYLGALLMEMDPQRHEQWRARIKSFFLYNRDGVLDDGTWPTAWTYDRKSKTLTPQAFPTVGGGVARTGRSAVFAMACVSGQRWLPNEDMQGVARKILANLDESTMRFILPLDDEHPLPAEWVVESELLDGDSITAWLAAYWEGRYRGYW